MTSQQSLHHVVTNAILAKDPSQARLLMDILRSEAEPEVRATAAHGLGVLGDARATTVLLDALFDENWSVRSNAGWALVAFGGRTVPHLKQVQKAFPETAAAEMAGWVLDRIRNTPGGWLDEL